MPTSPEFRIKRHALLVRIAQKHGGAIVGARYRAMSVPLSLRCARAHRFAMKPKDLMRGLWCPRCRNLPRQEKFLRLAKALARRRGGACLAQEFRDARTPLPWQCKLGHRWLASWDNVANKRAWCPDCAHRIIARKKRRWWRERRAALRNRRRR
jgi:hypothetical protein